LSFISRHIQQYRSEYGEKKAINELKKHLAWYCKGLTRAAALRNDIFRATTLFRLEDTIKTAFQTDTSIKDIKGAHYGTECPPESSAIAV
jgi:tRNA-dihydrouridine synthase